MSTAELLANREYKYGWTTDIESEMIPRGLNELLSQLGGTKWRYALTGSLASHSVAPIAPVATRPSHNSITVFSLR